MYAPSIKEAWFTDLGPVTEFEPVVPDAAWQAEGTRKLLAARDISGLFHLAQRFGISQGRLSAATSIPQGRVSEILHGKRQVTSLDLFERIADGLGMPDDCRILLGLAPTSPPDASREVRRVFTSQPEAEEEIRALASSATEIDLRILRGLGLIGLTGSLLRPAIVAARQARVRVLLLDPDATAARRRAEEIGEAAEAFSAGIRLVQARLRELAALPAVDLEVRHYRDLPVWRTLRFDDTVMVSSFDSQWEGFQSPIVVPAPGGMLHRGFRRAFEVAWEEGEPWSKPS